MKREYIISWDGLLLVLFCSSGPIFLPLNLKAETSIRQQERNLSSLTTGVWWEILKDCGEAWIFLHLGVDGSEPHTRARTKVLGFWHVKLLVLRSYNWRDKRGEAKCWPQTHKTMGWHWALPLSTALLGVSCVLSFSFGQRKRISVEASLKRVAVERSARDYSIWFSYKILHQWWN